MTAAKFCASNLADFPIIVHCDYIPRIQEVQASIYHIIREILEVLRSGQA
jgi:D-sedoheptulose 7-phosphate isomerase